MARRVVLRPAAEHDLQDLYVHIRDSRGGDPAVAIGYIRRIRAYCEGLETFPERGVLRDDIRPGLRLGYFERRIVIAYLITPDLVRIGRIFHGGQDYEALLGESGQVLLQVLLLSRQPRPAARDGGLSTTLRTRQHQLSRRTPLSAANPYLTPAASVPACR